MNKHLFIIILGLFLLSSCEKYDIPADYPTTYSRLSLSEYNQKVISYELKNIYISSSLDEFGFCGFPDTYDDILIGETPPYQGTFTKTEAIEILKNFISNNSSETGVSNPSNITFSQESTSTGFNGSIGWYFKTDNQKIDTIEILNSTIIFHVTNKEMTWCVGNWYPQVYVPSEFNINNAKAKSFLNKVEVIHYSIAGEKRTVKITMDDLDKSKISLKILPKESEDKIELRICWEFNIPGPVHYKMYVDVITGDLIGQVPTVIS